MAFEKSLTTRKSLLGLITIWVCLCAFSLFSISQATVLSWVEMTEGEIPAQEDEEDEEDCEEELEVLASSRRRRIPRRHEVVRYNALSCSDRSNPIILSGCHRLAIIGHQVANGLCASLLV